MAEVPEAAAAGAALLAGVGIGRYTSAGAALSALRYDRRIVEPDPARARWYADLYDRAYRPLYAALREVHGALDALRSAEGAP